MRPIILRGAVQRAHAKRLIDSAPDNAIVQVTQPSRNADQNARMWAMLHDIRDAKPEGRQWTAETWKCAFMHSLGHQISFCEGLDNSGPFPMGFKSSKLTVRQMADLITVISEYGDRHQVKWSDPTLKHEQVEEDLLFSSNWPKIITTICSLSGVTQGNLADELCVSPQAVSQFRNGKNAPSAETATKLKAILRRFV